MINLSSVRAGQEQTDPAKEGGQEWEKPQEQPEPPRRGRRPKNKEAPAQGERPKRKGRPPKAEKQTPGGGGAGKTAKTATRGKAAGKSTPAKEEIPPPPAPAPEEPTQPKDASRGEKEEIVYLDLDQLYPFQNHPFGVRDDMEMKGLVSSVQAGGVHQPRGSASPPWAGGPCAWASPPGPGPPCSWGGGHGGEAPARRSSFFGPSPSSPRSRTTRSASGTIWK